MEISTGWHDFCGGLIAWEQGSAEPVRSITRPGGRIEKGLYVGYVPSFDPLGPRAGVGEVYNREPADFALVSK